MAPRVSTTTVGFLLVAAILAAYFNMRAERADLAAEASANITKALPPTASLSAAPLSPVAAAAVAASSSSTPTVVVVITAPVQSSETQLVTSSSPSVPLSSLPTSVAAPSSAEPLAAPKVVLVPDSGSVSPSPSMSVRTPTTVRLAPQALPSSIDPPSALSLWTTVVLILICIIGGLMVSVVFLSNGTPTHPPAADAGSAWAQAAASLPRSRLPVSTNPGSSQISDPVRDRALLGIGQRKAATIVTASPTVTAAAAWAPPVANAIIAPPAVLVAPKAAPLTPSLSSSSSSSSSSVASSTRSVTSANPSPALPSPIPSPTPSPAPTAAAPTPVQLFAESVSIPLPPTHSPPPPPVEVAQPTPIVASRTDLALASSRFMLGVVGKSTPQNSSQSELDLNGTPTKTWKWRENDAKRKEEAAVRAKVEGSSPIFGSPTGSGIISNVSVPEVSRSKSEEVSVSQSPPLVSASALVDADNSEEGARKEEARLARSMSKKGMRLV